jgi:hypothetical protein
MNELAIEDLGPASKRMEDTLKSACTVLTSHGAPLALMLRLDVYDREDLQYMISPDFWKMIEQRRAEVTVPWEQVKAELLADNNIAR